MKERVRRLRTDALAAWADYQTTGLHLTAEEADTWLAKLAAGKRAAIPKWHV
jgi:predicted transcriptional regulator